MRLHVRTSSPFRFIIDSWLTAGVADVSIVILSMAGLGYMEIDSGVSFLPVYPVPVGGMRAMNASRYGGETWDRVGRVQVVERSGTLHQRTTPMMRSVIAMLLSGIRDQGQESGFGYWLPSPACGEGLGDQGVELSKHCGVGDDGEPGRGGRWFVASEPVEHGGED